MTAWWGWCSRLAVGAFPDSSHGRAGGLSVKLFTGTPPLNSPGSHCSGHKSLALTTVRKLGKNTDVRPASYGRISFTVVALNKVAKTGRISNHAPKTLF